MRSRWMFQRSRIWRSAFIFPTTRWRQRNIPRRNRFRTRPQAIWWTRESGWQELAAAVLVRSERNRCRCAGDSAVIAMGASDRRWRSLHGECEPSLAERPGGSIGGRCGHKKAGVLGVVDVGIGGNRVLLDGYGPNASIEIRPRCGSAERRAVCDRAGRHQRYWAVSRRTVSRMAIWRSGWSRVWRNWWCRLISMA